jgi:phosphoketolase
MGTDKVAITFAAWLEAHKKHVECEKRLKHAVRVSKQMGTLPPQELVDECKRLKDEADRLLATAQAQMKAGPSNG